MYRIGLTGGIGSGKSTVSSYMAGLGIPVIDADLLARKAVTPGSPALDEIRRTFGSGIFRPDGTLDREKTAALVFSHEDRRQAINGIIHPFIWNETEKELIRLQRDGEPLAVLDVPLLLEIGWQLRSESVWVVKATLEQQLRRLSLRNGYSEEEAMSRIRKQMSTEDKLRYADVVIDNSGDVAETEAQVKEALRSIPAYRERGAS